MRTICLMLSLTLGLLCSGAATASEHNGLLAQAGGAPKGPEVCTEVYQPVCGTDASGKRVTYSNACFARVAKASNVTPGACQ
jgi:hypothetical protein